MSTATAPKKHRAADRIATLEAEVHKLTASALQGISDATELAAARERIEQLEEALERAGEQYARSITGAQRENADLRRRLDIAVLANAAADETQAIDTDTVRAHVVQHLTVLDPNADTVQLPITHPAHIPGAA